MKFNTCAFLADENIQYEVVGYLKERGFDVFSTHDLNLNGKADEVIAEVAIQSQRVILTQDSDFGTLLFTTNKEFLGIVFLRPGHFSADFHIATLKTIIEEDIAVEPTFIIVAENSGRSVKIRIRNSVGQ
jgi:predicted nuclease of predicted toxin-antitoxin system